MQQVFAVRDCPQTAEQYATMMKLNTEPQDKADLMGLTHDPVGGVDFTPRRAIATSSSMAIQLLQVHCWATHSSQGT